MYKRAIVAECNDTYARIRGWQSADELIGRRQRDILPGRPEWLIRVFTEFVERDYRFVGHEAHRVDAEGNEYWYLNDVHGTVEHGRLVRAWGIQRDISERKRWELKQQLLMRELDHRVKNNLAAVLALSQQSLRESSTLAEFESAFTGRIAAMGRTHEALASMRWEGVRLMTIIGTSLPPFVPTDRIGEIASGDDVTLPAHAAIPVSLTLHELATNAAKHGALTTSTGRINITWQAQDNAVDLHWREVGGPSIEHELAGGVDVAFQPDGLQCRVRIPLTFETSSVSVPLVRAAHTGTPA